MALFMALGLFMAVPSFIYADSDAEIDADADIYDDDETFSYSGADRAEYPLIDSLVFERQVQLNYAEGFDIYCYEGGYKYFRIYESRDYLLVPEGKEVPDMQNSDAVILRGPMDHLYMAASSVMALFRAIDALDTIRLSALNADSWYVEEARMAMENGDILFAGKYSEPDYELLIGEGCRAAIESTMILHTPKVQEMIENLGIPVFIDRSGYETHPLGRAEWVKLYGAMTGHEEQAEAFFEKQAETVEGLADFTNTEKTVAFFFVDSQGAVVVRTLNDYVPKMIELAGGRYALGEFDFGETRRSTEPITMEDFYASALDADYLVYNGTIDTPLGSKEELLQKSPLFADFKAFKEDNVWCTDSQIYQASDSVAELIEDFHVMVTDGDAGEMSFLKKLG